MGRPVPRTRLAAAALLLLPLLEPWTVPTAAAYDLDPDSAESVKSIAKSMAQDMLTFYPGGEPGHTPGLLELPYYWWYGGAMLGSLVDYRYYTGDDSFNDLITDGLLAQIGDASDYMPENQTLTEGNDDQGFWALAVMSAAEEAFPDPPPDQPQWLALAQAVFNTQAARWDDATCAGGLRWQIFTWNNGYDYKNSISQACFFALAARLALYTGNSSYAAWADRVWDWVESVRLLDNSTYSVYDGTNVGTGCTDIVPYQWTYNSAMFILGAAAMYNRTEHPMWRDRLAGLVAHASDVFFVAADDDQDGGQRVMIEAACETLGRCNTDEQSFKAYLGRSMAAATKWAPAVTEQAVLPLLRDSAVAAAAQCTGGPSGTMCGLRWTGANGSWDGTTSLGQQMAAMQVTLAMLVGGAAAPLTSATGGTSRGDPSAGTDDIEPPTIAAVLAGIDLPSVTGADRAAAAFLTLMLLGGLVGVIWLMVADETGEATLGEQLAEARREMKDMASDAKAAWKAGDGTAAAVAAVLHGREMPAGYLRPRFTGRSSSSVGSSVGGGGGGGGSIRGGSTGGGSVGSTDSAKQLLGRSRATVKRTLPMGWPMPEGEVV